MDDLGPMVMPRFLAFGCSFTNYQWPTWADIIAEDLVEEFDYENWGLSGVGNQCIMSQMLRADLRDPMQDHDCVMVMWSSWSREDRFLDGRWQSAGNISNSQFYGEKWVKRYWSRDNDVIKNSTAILACNRMFDITYQAHIEDPYWLELDRWQHKRWVPVPQWEFYRAHEISMPVFVSKDIYHFDGHPSVQAHLAQVEHIYASWGRSLRPETKQMYLELDSEIRQIDQWPRGRVFEKREKMLAVVKQFNSRLRSNPEAKRHS